MLCTYRLLNFWSADSTCNFMLLILAKIRNARKKKYFRRRKKTIKMSHGSAVVASSELFTIVNLWKSIWKFFIYLWGNFWNLLFFIRICHVCNVAPVESRFTVRRNCAFKCDTLCLTIDKERKLCKSSGIYELKTIHRFAGFFFLLALQF